MWLVALQEQVTPRPLPHPIGPGCTAALRKRGLLPIWVDEAMLALVLAPRDVLRAACVERRCHQHHRCRRPPHPGRQYANAVKGRGRWEGLAVRPEPANRNPRRKP